MACFPRRVTEDPVQNVWHRGIGIVQKLDAAERWNCAVADGGRRLKKLATVADLRLVE